MHAHRHSGGTEHSHLAREVVIDGPAKTCAGDEQKSKRDRDISWRPRKPERWCGATRRSNCGRRQTNWLHFPIHRRKANGLEPGTCGLTVRRL